MIIKVILLNARCNVENKTKRVHVTVKTQQQCKNIIIILFSQKVSVLLDHLQASIQRHELQSNTKACPRLKQKIYIYYFIFEAMFQSNDSYYQI